MARVVAIALLGLLVCIALLETASNGFSLGYACHFGFGPKQQALERQAARSMFVERLPESLHVGDFRCSGYRDKSVTFAIRMANADARVLLEDLENTYNTMQNGPHYIESSKEVTRFPDKVRTKMSLPGVSWVHVREVVVIIPVDAATPAIVSFKGWQI
jgi:hypothetical protein